MAVHHINFVTGSPYGNAPVMNRVVHKSKRSRKSAPKSRQGCITCKSRHVKCDEAKPFCKRCAKAGMKCLGYVQEGDSPPDGATQTKQQHHTPSNTTKTGSRSSAPPLHLDKPVKLTSSNALETRSLEYFYSRTAPSISGYFDSNFYNRILLQAGESELAIRHAMMAVAAMHEHFEFTLVPSLKDGREEPPSNDIKQQFALRQYNKAISVIKNQLSHGPSSVESVLMCCLLFVCLECLRGDTTSAVSHLRSGGNIIANWKTQNEASSPTTEAVYSSVTEKTKPNVSNFVNDHLIPIFERLSCHVDGAGRITSSEYADLINPNISQEKLISDEFNNINEARNIILNLGGVMSRFIREVAFQKYSAELSEEQILAAGGLVQKLEKCERSLDNLIQENPDLRDSRKATVLKVQNRLFIVAAKGALYIEQRAHDDLADDFEILLTHAETLVGDESVRIPAKDAEEDLRAFSFEEGVSPACFYTATRCRVPRLRRKAIELLWKSPRRQGIWNSVLLARVSERIMELEENFDPPSPTVTNDIPPPILAPIIDPAIDAVLPLPDLDPTLLDMPLTPESLPSSMSVQKDPLEFDLSTEYPESFSEEPSLPSEQARIHHAEIKESTDTPHQHAVVFFRKPNGLENSWEMWTETITI